MAPVERSRLILNFRLTFLYRHDADRGVWFCFCFCFGSVSVSVRFGLVPPLVPAGRPASSKRVFLIPYIRISINININTNMLVCCLCDVFGAHACVLWRQAARSKTRESQSGGTQQKTQITTTTNRHQQSNKQQTQERTHLVGGGGVVPPPHGHHVVVGDELPRDELPELAEPDDADLQPIVPRSAGAGAVPALPGRRGDSVAGSCCGLGVS